MIKTSDELLEEMTALKQRLDLLESKTSQCICQPKETYITGDVFIDKCNRTYILTYIEKGSFLPLYSAGGCQHNFYMGGYCFLDGQFRVSTPMCYTIEELIKNYKVKKVGVLKQVYAHTFEEGRK